MPVSQKFAHDTFGGKTQNLQFFAILNAISVISKSPVEIRV